MAWVIISLTVSFVPTSSQLEDKEVTHIGAMVDLDNSMNQALTEAQSNCITSYLVRALVSPFIHHQSHNHIVYKERSARCLDAYSKTANALFGVPSAYSV